MYIEFTDGPKNLDTVIAAWKKGESIKVLVEFTNKQIKKLKNKDDLRPGRIYSLDLRFHDFQTKAAENKCVITHDLPVDQGDLAGFRYEALCDLSDGTGYIEAKQVP